MASAILFAVCILAGIILGHMMPIRKEISRISGMLQSFSLYCLMFLMGLRLQSDPAIWQQMGRIGLQALAIALAAIAGSVFLVWVFQNIYLRHRRIDLYNNEEKSEEKLSHPLGSLLMILAFILLGVITGTWGGEGKAITWLVERNGPIVDILLGLMIMASGVSVGQKKGIWKDVKNSGWLLLAVPGCVLVASMLSPLLISPLLRLHPLEAMSCGAGCGWYSFTGVVLGELSPEMGALGLLSNLFREMLALAITPFVAYRFGPLAAVAPGGATTMDVTLPLVVRSTAPGNAILAFSNGLLLTMVIPLVLRFLVSLA